MRTCYFRSIIPLQLQSFTPSASQLISYWSAVTALHCIRHYLLSQYTAYWAPLLAHEDYHHINNTQLSSQSGLGTGGPRPYNVAQMIFLFLLIGLVGLVIVEDVLLRY